MPLFVTFTMVNNVLRSERSQTRNATVWSVLEFCHQTRLLELWIDLGRAAMRLVLGVFGVALLVGPAVAQMGGINVLGDNERMVKTQEDVDKAKAAEDAYKSTMKKIPDQKKATNDPWADARGVSEPKVQKQGRSNPSNKSN
jgi:hypothetical protein